MIDQLKIGLIAICLAYAIFTYMDWSSCMDCGGTYVRGVFAFKCLL